MVIGIAWTSCQKTGSSPQEGRSCRGARLASLLTDLLETAVISLWLFSHSVGPDQFADVEDNANYWGFVVVAWLPIDALVYWMPRLT